MRGPPFCARGVWAPAVAAEMRAARIHTFPADRRAGRCRSCMPLRGRYCAALTPMYTTARTHAPRNRALRQTCAQPIAILIPPLRPSPYPPLTRPNIQMERGRSFPPRPIQSPHSAPSSHSSRIRRSTGKASSRSSSGSRPISPGSTPTPRIGMPVRRDTSRTISWPAATSYGVVWSCRLVLLISPVIGTRARPCISAIIPIMSSAQPDRGLSAFITYSRSQPSRSR